MKKLRDTVIDTTGRKFMVTEGYCNEADLPSLASQLATLLATPGTTFNFEYFGRKISLKSLVIETFKIGDFITDNKGRKFRVTGGHLYPRLDIERIVGTLTLFKDIDAYSEVTVALEGMPAMTFNYEKDQPSSLCTDLDRIAQTMYGKKEPLYYSTGFIIDEMRRLQDALFPGCAWVSPDAMVDEIKSLRAEREAFRKLKSAIRRELPA